MKLKKINFKKVVNEVMHTTKKHSPAILTGLGVAGLVGTAVLTGKATIKAVRLVDEAEMHKGEELTKKEVLATAWKSYIPPVAIGTASIACIIGANSVNAKRHAALATAYELTSAAFADYKDEVVRTIGEKKEKLIDKKVVEKTVKDHPVDDKTVIITGNGDVLCYDYFSGRYFKSNILDVKRAINIINQTMLSDNYVSVNDFWSEIGLPATDMGFQYGFNIDNGMVDIMNPDSIVSENGEPALVIRFDREPKLNYDMFA